MNPVIALFRKAYTAEQLSGALSAFDVETETLQARQFELGGLIENALALVAVGEGDAKALKDLQREAVDIIGKLAGRPGARERIARELEVRQAEEAGTRRLAKIAEARAWQKRMATASDELVAAISAVTEKLEALRQVDAQMPSFINEAKSSVAPSIGGWLSTFRYYVEPDAFGHAIGALTGQRALLDQVLAEIEAGLPSRADRRSATGLPA